MQAFTLIEVVIAGAVAVILGVAVVEALLISQRLAAEARLFTNARVIVQRNIDATLGATFNSTANPPPMLTVTGTSGVICDDDAGSNLENISVLLSGALGSGSGTLVTGTLKRWVNPLPSVPPWSTSGSSPYPSGMSTLVVYEIKFQVDYDYGLTTYGTCSHFSYSESTLKSLDSQ